VGKIEPGDKINKEESIESIMEMERRAFPYDALVSATRNFSEKLGEGGFGPVFKVIFCEFRVLMCYYMRQDA
jgi:hypothetical protein